MRGREAGKIAELTNNGWELTSQQSGPLRTELTFRKAQPESSLSKLLTAFHTLAPATRRRVLTATGIVATTLVALVVILIVVSGADDTKDSVAMDEQRSAADPELAPEQSETVLTDEQVWAASYENSKTAYAAKVAAALGVRKIGGLTSDVPLGSCGLLKKKLPIGARTSAATQALRVRRPPTARQVFKVISAATTFVCPELATRHRTQVLAFTRAAREAALRKQREAEARQRRKDRREAEADQPPPPATVYYANCTEVENAGAAPIYTGQPGYSGELDSDGDGIACE